MSVFSCLSTHLKYFKLCKISMCKSLIFFAAVDLAIKNENLLVLKLFSHHTVQSLGQFLILSVPEQYLLNLFFFSDYCSGEARPILGSYICYGKLNSVQSL